MSDENHPVPEVEPAAGERAVLDAGGHVWRVFEREYSPEDRRKGLALVFWSEEVIRIVRRFPPDWRTLPDEALMTVSWGR